MEEKYNHSKQTSKDLSSNVLTRDADNSEEIKSDSEQVPHRLTGFRQRKPSGSFTVIFQSENFSSKEISAGDVSNKNTVSRCNTYIPHC